MTNKEILKKFGIPCKNDEKRNCSHMTSKEALSDLSFLAIGDENHTIKCKETIEKDLDLLSRLVVENGLLKKDLIDYQEYIKKGVEEHYKDFMSDYDLLLQEYQELYKKLEVLEIIRKSITNKENHKYVLNEKLKGQKFMIMSLCISGDTDFNKIKEWLEDETIL